MEETVLTNNSGDKKRLFDPNQPILNQVWKLNPTTLYAEYIYDVPPTKKVRLMDYNLIEMVSSWPYWWLIYFAWVPIILGLLWKSYESGNSLSDNFVAFFLGTIIWSFLEYAFHRYIFHYQPNSVAGNTYHFLVHGVHHLAPLDETRIVFPPWLSLPTGYFVYWLTTLVDREISLKWALLAGIAVGYLAYDTVHFYCHHNYPNLKRVPLLGSYFKTMKYRHQNHHFINHNMNFGVTSPLFDWVFGTSASVTLKTE